MNTIFVASGSDEERSNSELASDEDDSDMGAALEQVNSIVEKKLLKTQYTVP